MRDRNDRLQKIFLAPSKTTAQQADRIVRESARYNIGDISLMDLRSMVSAPQRGTLATGSLTFNIRPTLINVARFGFVRDVAPNEATSPTLAATLLNVPGTNTSAGPIALRYFRAPRAKMPHEL